VRMGVNERKALEERRATRNERIVKAKHWAFRRGWKVLGILMLAGAVLYGAQLALTHVKADRWIVLSKVELTGNQILTWEEILATGGVEIGMPMWGMPVDSIEARIAKMDIVRQVEVKRSFPSSIEINVVEVDALLTVYDRRGVSVISDKGTKIPHRDGQAWQTPILVDVNAKQVERAVRLLKEMKEKEPWLYFQVSQVNFPQGMDGVEVFLRNAAHKVWFGKKPGAKEFRNYRILVRTMRQDLTNVSLIDMRFSGMAVARLGNRENNDG